MIKLFASVLQDKGLFNNRVTILAVGAAIAGVIISKET